ncbi:preprotein translocase subunit SecE [bacterium]|nr:preprotein translocase subunit SecE [bacterium]NBX78151.1 preprotein translocase subunit SecE [bacterium]
MMKNITVFLKEVRAEVSKIIWPVAKEFYESTMVALVVILLFTLFLSGINYVFYLGVQQGFKILSQIM